MPKSVLLVTYVAILTLFATTRGWSQIHEPTTQEQTPSAKKSVDGEAAADFDGSIGEASKLEGSFNGKAVKESTTYAIAKKSATAEVFASGKFSNSTSRADKPLKIKSSVTTTAAKGLQVRGQQTAERHCRFRRTAQTDHRHSS